MPTVPPSSQPAISTVISMRGAGERDRDAALGHAGHQAVARAGAPAGADVEAGGDRDGEDRRDA